MYRPISLYAISLILYNTFHGCANACSYNLSDRCDEILGISGFCCRTSTIFLKKGSMVLILSLAAIGTSCRALQSDKIVHCIDALGTTALGLPSATTGLVPSATPVLGSDPNIVYNPPNAWTVSESESNCTTSKSLHVTDTINASVSFNFTGKVSNIKIERQYD